MFYMQLFEQCYDKYKAFCRLQKNFQLEYPKTKMSYLMKIAQKTIGLPKVQCLSGKWQETVLVKYSFRAIDSVRLLALPSTTSLTIGVSFLAAKAEFPVL
jgi:hypothetical protein